MSILDYDIIERVVDLPKKARRLLAEPEFEISARLDIFIKGRLRIFNSYVVYYSTVRGPAKGGIRFNPTVSLEETRDLAERMVYKTALVNIPFGGGKSGVQLDPTEFTRQELNSIVKEYVHVYGREIHPNRYIPAPDMGTGPREMMAIYGETHTPESVTGKPVAVGGLPGRLEATGRGVATSSKLAAERYLHKDLNQVTVAIQGFGNVGSQAARFLHEWGAKVVAVSDIETGLFNPDGLDISEMIEGRDNHPKPVRDFEGERITNDQLIALDVDILVPAACENVLTADNAGQVKAAVVVEGANGPTTQEADELLRAGKIQVIPDILANSGGVIASYAEWHQGKSGSLTDASETFETIDKLITKAFQEVIEEGKKHRLSLRDIALALAVDKLIEAMKGRGWI
ncbi:Glu/Leu/Phe/Val dehydrogenase [candidate division KSB1 bacterium]